MLIGKRYNILLPNFCDFHFCLKNFGFIPIFAIFSKFEVKGTKPFGYLSALVIKIEIQVN
jgi:hypothetical protein